MENVADKIAFLKTDTRDARDAPIESGQAKIIKITVRDDWPKLSIISSEYFRAPVLGRFKCPILLFPEDPN